MNELKKNVKVIRQTIGTETEGTIRVGAYCRVSTDSEEQADSFITQVKYYSDFIRNSSNMILVDIYADEGITGTSVSKRPEFQRMLKDSKRGKLDRIYVKSISRFARNSLECIENIRLLKSYGTSVLFENDNIDTEKMNSEMILYIKSAFAQSEALANSKRVSTAVRMRMERGEFVASSVPFGYRLENNILIPEPKEAEVVKQIYQMYHSGIGIGTIVQKLNHSNTCNIDWQLNHVKYILKNEKYIGDSLYQKTYTPQQLPLKKTKNRGQVDKYYATNTHEGIIDKSLFDEIQLKFHKNYERYKQRKAAQSYFFSGLMYCSDCGRSYRLGKSGDKEPIWVCSRDGIAGQRCCTHQIAETKIERTFISMFNLLQQNRDILINQSLKRLESIKRQCTAKDSAINEIDSEVAELSEKAELYVRLKSKGIIDEISYTEQSGVVKKRINELRSRRKKLLGDDEEEQIIERLREIKDILETAPESKIDFDKKLFVKLVKKIKVKPESLEFEFHCGLKLEESLWN